MIVELFSVRDSVTNFKLPFPARNEADAVRSFRIVLSDPKSDFFNIRNDCQLWYVGSYDDNTGKISGDPKFLTNGVEQLVTEEEIS